MKVKIKNIIYEPTESGPIMVILEPHEKKAIANMSPEMTRFVSFNPNFWDKEHIRAWMEKVDGDKTEQVSCGFNGCKFEQVCMTDDPGEPLVPMRELEDAKSRISKIEAELGGTREELADAYMKLSGKQYHASDCSTSVAPAERPGPCDCDAPANREEKL